ncbi:hypothetical protein SEMRO_1773_G296740.1 [Seminavis robusta]|uniref:Uncharacterized protein n=1 Tax=Seminavis robusta TaxID=568900 RepID=A0A9N8EV33_9STRA|nr:hypothetical protein SEMRO_1773_G296740.1 [Seminavis robusta]|eukprot:Sro1773_g296740.1 n/a (446) ;mRNA; r:11522-12859
MAPCGPFRMRTTAATNQRTLSNGSNTMGDDTRLLAATKSPLIPSKALDATSPEIQNSLRNSLDHAIVQYIHGHYDSDGFADIPLTRKTTPMRKAYIINPGAVVEATQRTHPSNRFYALRDNDQWLARQVHDSDDNSVDTITTTGTHSVADSQTEDNIPTPPRVNRRNNNHTGKLSATIHRTQRSVIIAKVVDPLPLPPILATTTTIDATPVIWEMQPRQRSQRRKAKRGGNIAKRNRAIHPSACNNQVPTADTTMEPIENTGAWPPLSTQSVVAKPQHQGPTNWNKLNNTKTLTNPETDQKLSPAMQISRKKTKPLQLNSVIADTPQQANADTLQTQHEGDECSLVASKTTKKKIKFRLKQSIQEFLCHQLTASTNPKMCRTKTRIGLTTLRPLPITTTATAITLDRLMHLLISSLHQRCRQLPNQQARQGITISAQHIWTMSPQ